MLKKLVHPSTAIALLAFFVATSGGAFAAGHLIGSREIADHSIQLRDLSPAAITALRGHNGEPGPAGANGTLDPAKVAIVNGADVVVQSGQVGNAFASCPAGQVATGGGGTASIAGLAYSGPAPATAGGTTPSAWVIYSYNQSSIAVTIRAFAVCAAP